MAKIVHKNPLKDVCFYFVIPINQSIKAAKTINPITTANIF